MLLSFVIIFCAIIIAIAIAIGSLRRRIAPGSISLSVYALALMTWAVAYSAYISVSQEFRPLILGVIYLNATLASTALFAFALEYIGRERWLTVRNVLMLCLEPFFTLIILFTNTAHKFFLSADNTRIIAPIGEWLIVHTIYTNLLVLFSAFLILRNFMYGPLPYRLQSVGVLSGIFTPLLAALLQNTTLRILSPLELSLSAYTITGVGFLYALTRYRLLDVLPIPRNAVIENMQDGWVVLDMQSRIVDLNLAAEQMTGVMREKMFGQPAENILIDWSNILESLGEQREHEVRGSVNLRAGRRYLHLRISPLIDKNGIYFGRLVQWRDITERRKADEARQRARDEMFSLLHAISGAASHSHSVEDFLNASAYHLTNSFNGETTVIFLLETSANKNRDDRLLLAAHYDTRGASADNLSFITEEDALLGTLLESREPILIPDMSTDQRLPPTMRRFGVMLLVPMITQDIIVGMIGLVRKENQIFSGDEIARLATASEDVAAFVNSGRRSQIAIALAERQRVVRDLHDSVTQKLYGLVTLTEAAKAGANAGETGILAKILPDIGDSARQALKEMRLFLHQLQPVDIERDGLVAVLQQRLLAVEGRSNIKPRLIADNEFTMQLDKEIAYYFIAQEALNNISRHASAKTITIYLKRRSKNVTLEIEDDGLGFDIKKSDNGGMGLKNMRERAVQIGAKFKIKTAPNKGTKITVTVPEDRMPKVKRKGHMV